ncbi:MAG: DUF2214 family protein [Alphaproteobacteria bacterium]|nr:DUF2214 family protein [Alphaproteobacteria bacterium]
MDIDLLLTMAHHLSVFAIVAIVAAEFALLRPGISGVRLHQLATVDRYYGIAAVLVLAAGIGRVFLGRTDASYYLGNHVFWGKMMLFLAVGLLSVQPTMAFLNWSRRLKSDPGFAPSAGAIAKSRRFIHLQVIGLALIPLFAAAMARGYGSV